MMLIGLASVARAAGLRVVEINGWQHRGHGPQTDVLGVTAHHTANGGAGGNAPSLRVVRDGREGLSGPLAHYVLGRDGTVYVVAAGLCYHAGVSNSRTRTNSHRIGIEAEAAGDGRASDWPPVQVAAYHLLCKALMKHYGFSIHNVLGHKETCSPHGRKTDPTLNMTSFRDGVQHAVLGQQPTGDDMELSDKVNLTPKAEAALGGPTKSVGYLLQWPASSQLARQEIERARQENATAMAALNATIAAQKASLDALAAGVAALVSNQPAAIKQAFDDGVAAVKAELGKIEITVATGPAGGSGEVLAPAGEGL